MCPEVIYPHAGGVSGVGGRVGVGVFMHLQNKRWCDLPGLDNAGLHGGAVP